MSMHAAVALAVTIPTLVIASDSFGQEGPDPEAARTRVVLSSTLGPGSMDIGGQASLSVGRSWGDVMARVAGTGSLDFFLPSGSSENVSSDDIALLYGRRHDVTKGWLRASAGPGYVRAVRTGELEGCFIFFCGYERIETTTVGLAMQAEAVWAPWTWFGVGVNAFGNLNGQASFAALTIGLYVGSLR